MWRRSQERDWEYYIYEEIGWFVSWGRTCVECFGGGISVLVVDGVKGSLHQGQAILLSTMATRIGTCTFADKYIFILLLILLLLLLQLLLLLYLSFNVDFIYIYLLLQHWTNLFTLITEAFKHTSYTTHHLRPLHGTSDWLVIPDSLWCIQY